MQVKLIQGWNMAPGAPTNWDPKIQGECHALPIRVHPPEALQGDVKVAYCDSAWQPDPLELEHLIQGGQIVLRVAGYQVPVNLSVEPAEIGLREPLSSAFQRGFMIAISRASAFMMESGLTPFVPALAFLGNWMPDKDAMAVGAAQGEVLMNVKYALATVLNMINRVDRDLSDDELREAGERSRDNLLEAGAFSPDGLNHAPRCPAARMGGIRLPTGPCSCGAQQEADLHVAQVARTETKAKAAGDR